MIEKIKPTANILKKISNWARKIFSINARIKKLEELHYGNKPHPADICPQCGAHTIRHEIRRCDERYRTDNHYAHKQTDWEVCSAYPYEKGGDTIECHTESPVTQNPSKTDWTAIRRHFASRY